MYYYFKLNRETLVRTAQFTSETEHVPATEASIFIEVTEAQYNAGYEALDPAVVTAGVAAAKAYLTDPSTMVDPAVEALALVIIDELNILRAEHGLADRTTAQLKAAMASKL